MRAEIQAFVLSKNGEVIDVFPDFEDAMEAGAAQYMYDVLAEFVEDNDDQAEQFVAPRWAQESDDTWVLWGEDSEYTITVR